MAFFVALFFAIFVLDPPWSYAAVVGGVAVEVSEASFWLWWSRRRLPRTGVQTLVGRYAVVVRACRPEGLVKVDGELWQARCAAGAGEDDAVQVAAVEGLTLVGELDA